LTAHGWSYSWQWNDSPFGFTLSNGDRTNNYITILFKKIKDFLIIGTLNNILFCVFTGSDQQLSGKDHEFL